MFVPKMFPRTIRTRPPTALIVTWTGIHGATILRPIVNDKIIDERIVWLYPVCDKVNDDLSHLHGIRGILIRSVQCGDVIIYRHIVNL